VVTAADKSDAARLLDATADGTDREALRYQAFCADRLLTRIVPAAGSRLLDSCAGSGVLALGAAQAVGPEGRVTAIDLSERLLGRLEAKIDQFGIPNIDVHVMDGARLDFRREYFHYLLCSLGLQRFADPRAVLREWQRVLCAGGRLGLVNLAPDAFQPMLGLLQQRLGRLGVVAEAPWDRVGDRFSLERMLQDSGFTDIELAEIQLGYHLDQVELWWEVIEHSALRAWIQPLTASQRQQLKSAHLDEVAPLVTENGLWLDVPVLMALARKP
jgi:SAM-dependent methyltransferase